MKSVWEKVAAENIVRHRSGKYYLNAKVRGRKIRQSLGTENLQVAKIKRDELLAEMRAMEASAAADVKTVREGIEVIRKRLAAEPGKKPNTRKFHNAILDSLVRTLPVEKSIKRLSKDDLRAWWSTFCESYSPTRSNAALGMVRKLCELAREAGVRVDDPSLGLKRQRVKASAVDDLPDRQVISSVIASVRAQKARHSEEVGNMLEFIAWSGLRPPSEVAGLRWEDIGKDRIRVTGGKEGTKNHEVRYVPISAPLRKLLGRMRYKGAAGPVFSIRIVKRALDAACDRLKVPRMRVYDLRHVFATHAIESGVDIPTVSRWLGHKDGGALAMRTYGHVRDDHSLAQVKKLG